MRRRLGGQAWWRNLNPQSEANEVITTRIRSTIIAMAVVVVAAAVCAPLASAGLPRGAGLGDIGVDNPVTPSPGAEITNGPLAGPVLRIVDADADIPAGHWRVHVYGTWEMSPASAQAAIDAGYRVVFRLYGDDLYSDQLLFGPYEYGTGKIGTTATGLWFDDYHLFIAKGGILNEDRKDPLRRSGDDRDEVYAEVQVIDPNGTVVRSGVSNLAVGYF
jgi:hypothetical protein